MYIYFVTGVRETPCTVNWNILEATIYTITTIDQHSKMCNFSFQKYFVTLFLYETLVILKLKVKRFLVLNNFVGYFDWLFYSCFTFLCTFYLKNKVLVYYIIILNNILPFTDNEKKCGSRYENSFYKTT